MQKRRAISTPGERKDPSARGPVTVVASLVLHVVLLAVLVQITLVRSEWLEQFMAREKPPVVERIGFMQLPRGEAPKEAPRRGGDDRPVSNAPPTITAPAPIAPAVVPNALPPIPATLPRTSLDAGTGPLVGGGGDTRGVRPAYTAPALWAPPGPVVTAPLTSIGKLDSAMAPTFATLADSIRRAAANQRDPNDWTKTIGGKKYGIDSKFIRLGPVSIPTPLLALLPLNLPQGNPTAMERERRLAWMRDEIQFQAAKAARDEEFNAAVKALRERKQKERDDKKKADAPPPKVIP